MRVTCKSGWVHPRLMDHRRAPRTEFDSATPPELEGGMLRFGVIVLSVFLGGAPAFAQVSATTGSINGKVSDATGGVLPGVTVTIASTNMQGTRTAVTDEGGDYRFPAVPPGDYKITYELGGFGS